MDLVAAALIPGPGAQSCRASGKLLEEPTIKTKLVPKRSCRSGWMDHPKEAVLLPLHVAYVALSLSHTMSSSLQGEYQSGRLRFKWVQ